MTQIPATGPATETQVTPSQPLVMPMPCSDQPSSSDAGSPRAVGVRSSPAGSVFDEPAAQATPPSNLREQGHRRVLSDSGLAASTVTSMQPRPSGAQDPTSLKSPMSADVANLLASVSQLLDGSVRVCVCLLLLCVCVCVFACACQSALCLCLCACAGAHGPLFCRLHPTLIL